MPELDQGLLEALRSLLDGIPDEFSTSALESLVGPFGSYDGLPPQTSWDADGRSMHLLAALGYHGPDGVDWPVPTGAWLDGASIPPALWTIVGGPFEGKYRNASIVHDHYCIIKSRGWQDTHRMFHDAMRCSGVSPLRANVMYYAVYRFGPRWATASALEDMQGDALLTSEVLDAVAGESLLRDAEAIVTHGLNTRDVEVLATLRGAQAGELSAEPANLEGLEVAGTADARLLVVPGGSGTAEDVAVVTAAAGRLPSWVITHFLKNKIRIIACRGSITDFETSQKGKVPRGWEGLIPKRTWDDVPGTYFQDKLRVVIATIDQNGGRVVPGKESGLHGSDDLVVHESLHGYDYSTGHAMLAAPTFKAARDADAGALPAYLKQDGQAGREETFAETGAQFCVDRVTMAQRCAHLAAFWDTMPLISEGMAEAAIAGDRAAVGVVTRFPDRSLALDLRATGEGGAIGHARFVIAAGDTGHSALEQRLFPGRNLEEFAQDKTESALFFGTPPQQRREKMNFNPLEAIDVGDVGLTLALEEVALPPQLDMTKLPDVVVSGTALVDFSAAKDVVVRSSVSLALLFASRVATKATVEGDDEDDWLARYVKALSEVGFRVSGHGIIHSELKKQNLSVHKAIIPFLTLAFGGAAAGPLIIAALNNLQSIDADAPWITLFDRQTRRFDVHEMHFAAVSANDSETAIRYAVARLHVETGETTILFFKFSSTAARFDSTTTTMTADNALLNAIEPKLQTKLMSIIDETIVGADI